MERECGNETGNRPGQSASQQGGGIVGIPKGHFPWKGGEPKMEQLFMILAVVGAILAILERMTNLLDRWKHWRKRKKDGRHLPK